LTGFSEFAARKQGAAVAAAIAPFVTERDRGREAGLRAIGNRWTRARFDGWFWVSPPPANLPSTSLVFVESRDGNTVAANPHTLGGGEADAHLIYEGLSRVAADAVLAGAGTVRGGRVAFSVWHPELVALRGSLGLPRHPIQIVATLRGMPLDGVLFNTPELRVIIITVAAVLETMHDALAARPWIDALPLRSAEELPAAFHDLRRRGIATISCVGGRTLADRLIDLGLVSDLYLTRSAKAGGEPHTPLYPHPLDGEIVVRKHGTGPDAGVTFTHVTRPCARA